MTKEEISKLAIKNQAISRVQHDINGYRQLIKYIENGGTSNLTIKDCQVMIKHSEHKISSLKSGKVEPTIVYSTVMFKNLTPGKGYLRLLDAVQSLCKTMGKNPTQKNISEYLNINYGLTAANSEAIQALMYSKMLQNEKGYYVTDFGQEVLKTYGC